jgi:hypothetical protein
MCLPGCVNALLLPPIKAAAAAAAAAHQVHVGDNAAGACISSVGTQPLRQHGQQHAPTGLIAVHVCNLQWRQQQQQYAGLLCG